MKRILSSLILILVLGLLLASCSLIREDEEETTTETEQVTTAAPEPVDTPEQAAAKSGNRFLEQFFTAQNQTDPAAIVSFLRTIKCSVSYPATNENPKAEDEPFFAASNGLFYIRMKVPKELLEPDLTAIQESEPAKQGNTPMESGTPTEDVEYPEQPVNPGSSQDSNDSELTEVVYLIEVRDEGIIILQTNEGKTKMIGLLPFSLLTQGAGSEENPILEMLRFEEGDLIPTNDPEEFEVSQEYLNRLMTQLQEIAASNETFGEDDLNDDPFEEEIPDGDPLFPDGSNDFSLPPEIKLFVRLSGVESGNISNVTMTLKEEETSLAVVSFGEEANGSATLDLEVTGPMNAPLIELHEKMDPAAKQFTFSARVGGEEMLAELGLEMPFEEDESDSLLPEDFPVDIPFELPFGKSDLKKGVSVNATWNWESEEELITAVNGLVTLQVGTKIVHLTANYMDFAKCNVGDKVLDVFCRMTDTTDLDGQYFLFSAESVVTEKKGVTGKQRFTLNSFDEDGKETPQLELIVRVPSQSGLLTEEQKTALVSARTILKNMDQFPGVGGLPF